MIVFLIIAVHFIILEALYLGEMVIATDCKSGPAEMITNDYNGF